ncbi:MAG: hypothetical protein IJW06_04355 [Clostridia bacterium]|nr:hypothetical protein [Clostridia bacterium]
MKKKKIMKRASIKEPLVAQIKEHKVTFAVYVVLRLIVIAVLILSLINRRFENVFVCSLTLVLFLVPAFFQKNFGIQLPSTLEIIIMLFIFAAEILGEIGAYYVKVPLWDTMLHTTNGFLCAAIGFSLVDLLNRNNRFKFHLSPLYLSIVAFCFSMTIGVLWEMFEFGADMLFATDMQKDFVVTKISSVALDETLSNKAVIVENISEVYINGEPLGLGGYLDIGIIDTMKDLIVNFIGAVVFSVIGFFYVKSRGKSRFAKRFIPTVTVPEPDIEEDDTQTNVKSD